MLHRDLKPSNIMLGPDGHARLMDFGLAVPLDLLATETSGRLMGTPQYMPPEQMAGRPLTMAADYFSLACVAYEMLIGRRLFPSDSSMRSCGAGLGKPSFGDLPRGEQ